MKRAMTGRLARRGAGHLRDLTLYFTQKAALPRSALKACPYSPGAYPFRMKMILIANLGATFAESPS